MKTDRHIIRPLTAETWPAYADLIERHGGVWGGCWCMVFHPSFTKGRSDVAVAARRAEKKAKVETGDAHAALVFDGEDCVGWAQFGGCQELPEIRSKKAYDAGLTALPDWRITCFFTDKAHRREGVAASALAGAIRLSSEAGGGKVEAYPEELSGQKTSSGFLWGGTMKLFENIGFERQRKIGLHRWVVSLQVPPTA